MKWKSFEMRRSHFVPKNKFDDELMPTDLPNALTIIGSASHLIENAIKFK